MVVYHSKLLTCDKGRMTFATADTDKLLGNCGDLLGIAAAEYHCSMP